MSQKSADYWPFSDVETSQTKCDKITELAFWQMNFQGKIRWELFDTVTTPSLSFLILVWPTGDKCNAMNYWEMDPWTHCALTNKQIENYIFREIMMRIFSHCDRRTCNNSFLDVFDPCLTDRRRMQCHELLGNGQSCIAKNSRRTKLRSLGRPVSKRQGNKQSAMHSATSQLVDLNL